MCSTPKQYSRTTMPSIKATFMQIATILSVCMLFFFNAPFVFHLCFFFRLFHYLIEKKRRKNNNIQVINGETNEIVNETHKHTESREEKKLLT